VTIFYETPSLFALAFTTVGKIATNTETLDVPSAFCKNFMNFGAVNHGDVVASLQKVGGCTHAKICTLALFPPESID